MTVQNINSISQTKPSRSKTVFETIAISLKVGQSVIWCYVTNTP